MAPTATPEIQAWAQSRKLRWVQRSFESRDLDGVLLCVIASSSKALNAGIFHEAQQRGILCNTVRDAAHSNFYYPAVVRRGPLQIAISTAGQSGALAKRLREDLESQFGPEWSSWLRWLGEARSALYDDALSPRQRRTLPQKLAGHKAQERVFSSLGCDPTINAFALKPTPP